MTDTQRKIRRSHRHLISHARTLFELWAMGDRAQVAIDATLTMIEQTVAEMAKHIKQSEAAQ